MDISSAPLAAQCPCPSTDRPGLSRLQLPLLPVHSHTALLSVPLIWYPLMLCCVSGHTPLLSFQTTRSLVQEFVCLLHINAFTPTSSSSHVLSTWSLSVSALSSSELWFPIPCTEQPWQQLSSVVTSYNSFLGRPKCFSPSQKPSNSCRLLQPGSSILLLSGKQLTTGPTKAPQVLDTVLQLVFEVCGSTPLVICLSVPFFLALRRTNGFVPTGWALYQQLSSSSQSCRELYLFPVFKSR